MGKEKQLKFAAFSVKKTTFLLIESGQKDLLVRSVTWIFSPANPGDTVVIQSEFGGKMRRCPRKIVAVRPYANMFEIVETEDLARLAHGDKVQTMSFLARIFRPDQEEGHAVVFELAAVDEGKPEEQPTTNTERW